MTGEGRSAFFKRRRDFFQNNAKKFGWKPGKPIYYELEVSPGNDPVEASDLMYRGISVVDPGFEDDDWRQTVRRG
jgi:hypothetical protein